MVTCAAVTIFCFKTEKGFSPPSERTDLSAQEILTLVAGVLFFAAFFVAMYAQVKARIPICKLIRRFWLLNYDWHVEEYQPERDPMRRAAIRAARKAGKAGQSTAAAGENAPAGPTEIA
jgi:hypothetical protein